MPATPTSTGRDLKIDTLRGLACLLVVTYHIGNNKGASGVPMEPGNAFHFMNELLSLVRMPLFTFISGYVYAARPVMPGAGGSFLLGKLRRLIVPLVAVGGLFLLVQNAVPHVHSRTPILDAWHILVYPYAHFWYLQALTLIFFLLVLLERLGQIATLGGWAAALIISVAASLFLKFTPDLFAVNEALSLLPLFLLGIGMHRFAKLFHGRTLSSGVIIAAGASFAIYALATSSLIQIPQPIRGVLFLAGGMATCIVLMRLQMKSRSLAFIGGCSYAIYLFHVFGTAGARVALTAIGVHNTAIVVIAALTAGIALPIAIEAAAARYGVTRFLLLGRGWLTPNTTNSLFRRHDRNSSRHFHPDAHPLAAAGGRLQFRLRFLSSQPKLGSPASM